MDATTYAEEPSSNVFSTYLLHGHMNRPQHFPKPFKLFSASFMSWLIWFMPSSTRSSCSGQDKGMTAVEWVLYWAWKKWKLLAGLSVVSISGRGTLNCEFFFYVVSLRDIAKVCYADFVIQRVLNRVTSWIHWGCVHVIQYFKAWSIRALLPHYTSIL